MSTPSPALLKKYDISGPRYTSYPTAAQFNTAFTAEDFLRACASRTHDAPLSLYVHLPFCRDICYYCACNKIVTRDRAQSARYLDYLRKEMQLIDEHLQWRSRPLTQLHWGGGTPTFLSDAEMTALMSAIAAHFHLPANGEHEFSIEIDPRTVDLDRLDVLCDLGFNRISLGVQDFDPAVQEAVNRRQSFDSVAALVERGSQRGIRSISFDLIYGLPLQTAHSMGETMSKVISLRPDRISCYNYAHLPERFSSQRAIGRQQLPSADEKLALVRIVTDQLSDAGYVHIGMDHFVLPQDTLALALRDDRLQRNFQGYSVNLAPDMLGLGVSAIGDVGTAYAQNYRQLDQYYAALDEGRLAIQQGLMLSLEDRIRRDIIQQITCHRRIDILAVEQRYGIDFHTHFADSLQQLQAMAEDGIVTLSPQRIDITALGQHFLRHVAMAFDEYMGDAAKRNIRFSRAL